MAAVILFPKHLSTDVPLHEAAKPLQWLLGKWKGQGKGIYPTIKYFEYIEDLEFFHVGQPMLQFRYVETKKYFGFLNKWQFQKNWPISTYLYLKDVLAIRAFYFFSEIRIKIEIQNDDFNMNCRPFGKWMGRWDIFILWRTFFSNELIKWILILIFL